MYAPGPAGFGAFLDLVKQAQAAKTAAPAIPTPSTMPPPPSSSTSAILGLTHQPVIQYVPAGAPTPTPHPSQPVIVAPAQTPGTPVSPVQTYTNQPAGTGTVADGSGGGSGAAVSEAGMLGNLGSLFSNPLALVLVSVVGFLALRNARGTRRY